jgi:hypothetical protein
MHDKVMRSTVKLEFFDTVVILWQLGQSLPFAQSW